MKIVETKLISSAGKLEKLPPPAHPEVAFAGRSNVGKSSILNALTGRKGLFKVSQKPGRTRTIVHVEARMDNNEKLYMVDLPGYGFAKVAKGAKENWLKLIEGYLADRTTLHLVVILVDVRRGPEEEEANLLEFLAEQGTPAILAATKMDRLPKSKRKLALQKLQNDTGARVIGTSAVDKEGIDKLLKTVAKFCGLVQE